MTTHLGTYSALVSASELALSAWLRKDQDDEQVLHATNVLAYVLEQAGPELPADVRRFQDAQPG